MYKKVIKRILKIFLWFIGIIITLDLLLVTLILIPPIQQFTLLKASRFLTNITGGEITINKIYLSPTLILNAKNVAIKDHHGNNMIFASKLKGRINYAQTGKGRITLSFAKLDEGEVVLRKYSGEESVNIAIWAKGFIKDVNKDPTFKLLFENINLEDVRFALILDDKRLYKEDNTIDYGYFELQHIRLNVENFLVFGPDISCKINSLTLSQYTGFEISNFTGDFRIHSQGLTLNDLHFSTPNSIFSGDFAFRYNDFPDYADFVNNIYFDTQIKSASIDFKDITYFAPAIEGMDNTLVASGYIGGTVNHLQTKDIYFKYNTQTYITGDFSIKDVIDFKNSSWNMWIKNSNINLSDLTQFKLPKGKTLSFSETIRKINYSKICGFFNGTLTNFITNLEAETNLGKVECSVNTTSQNNNIYYTGGVACKKLNIAKLLNQPEYLNQIDLKSSFEGEANLDDGITGLFSSMAIKVRGAISDVDILGYPVKDVNFSGNYNKKNLNLALQCADSIISFKVKGNLNFTNGVPNIETTLTKANIKLYDLIAHYPHKIDSATAQGFEAVILKIKHIPNLELVMDSITLVMRGNNFDNFNGYLGIDNAKLTNGVKASRIDWFRLNAMNPPNSPHQYIVHSNAVNLSLKTNYDFQDVKSVFINAAYHYLPRLFDKNGTFAAEHEINSTHPNPFLDLDIQLFYSRNLFELILPKLDISRNTTALVHFGKTKKEHNIQIYSPQIIYSGLGKVNNLTLFGAPDEQQYLVFELKCDSLITYQKAEHLSFSKISIQTKNNNEEVRFNLGWKNPKSISISELNNLSGFFWLDSVNNATLKINDSKIFLRESLWQFTGEKNTLKFGDRGYFFDNCVLSSTLGKLSINGEVSRYSDKECNILLEDFDISLLNNITATKGFSFGGDMVLDAKIAAKNEKILVDGKVLVKGFIFNEETFGNLFLDATILNQDNLYFFGGILPNTDNPVYLSTFSYIDYFTLQNRNIDLNGNYNVKQKELRVQAMMDTLRIGFLSPFLASFSNSVTGYASGQLNFVMNPDSLYFDGKVNVKEAQLGITPLNTNYYLTNQEILFNREGISFNNVVFKDKFNNEAKLSGTVHHKKFKDFNIDLNISAPKILAMNTKRSMDDSFFGDGIVSGDISIKGDTKQLNFTSHNIRTLPGSIITFPLSSASSVSTSRGIYFIQSSTSQNKSAEKVKPSSTVMNFDFTFDITKDADVVLDVDPIDGVLRCKTTGKLHLTYNTFTDILDLDGILSIVSGKFHMSLRNFFPKDFAIVEGGTISFIGPLTSAQINVQALYQKASSLNSLSPNLTYIGRTEVSAYLGLNGNLMNPTPNFIFAFPRLTNDDLFNVFALLDTTNTQNTIRQFFTFVFLNTFIATESGTFDPQNTINTGAGFVSGMLSSFISNQINNFSLGFNIDKQDNYQEYSVNARAQFYNNRIEIKVGLGYAENSAANFDNNNNVVGDVSIEYLLNPDGNWRIRAFYFNDKTGTVDNIWRPQQGGGVGITFQQEFDNRKDFSKNWSPKKVNTKQKK
ncbi:MAG: translocation/assembly module TamB [Bacteroidales bacterium]|jgi:hypothetical protein|nr:translocation/assembly module TamB [Bacteroidales bacterium]